MNPQFFNRMVWGLLLIALGVLFLFDQAGLLDFNLGDLVRTFWPVILIYFSAVGLIFQRSTHGSWTGNFIWNFVLLCIGLYFLARNLGVVQFGLGELFPFIIPVGLIIVGIGMIFKPHKKGQDRTSGAHPGASTHHNEPFGYDDGPPHGSHRPHEPRESYGPHEPYGPHESHGPHEPYGPHESQGSHEPYGSSSHHHIPKMGHDTDARTHFHTSDHTSYSHHSEYEYKSSPHRNHSEWFGDTYIGNEAWELKPMNVSHFIGDTVLDLTKAYIPVGETKINISSFIGDVKIFIPNDPELEIHTVASSFIGDSTVLDQTESGFFKSMNFMSPGYEDGLKKIRLNVSVFIGDLRVQRVG